ncbi:VHS and GAT domain containing protein [Musa troglodytarum]|uniref:VHS and GAT domain containing protein n=2 Tax=Musa troglodytarum TaxID=320322 RepID=A0A9E7FCZ9_9LILI|nr:VHS and GAT domain containing protein [Musa troglodytarum]
MLSSSSSSATVRVEKATSDLLMGPDWTLNMDICDSVNSDHGQAKDVVKAVKKRLQHKNPKVQFLALTLLETMIKNCGNYVHFQVVEREILQEMVKIVRKKTDMQVRDKILELLDSWQVAFGGAGGKYPQFYMAYADLKRSGVQFPERSSDSTLIFTPPVHATNETRRPPIGYGMPSNSALRLDEAMSSEMAKLSISDLASMQSVMELLSEMLKAVNPNDCSAVKDEVIIDLVNQCRSNQTRLMQLIDSIRDEELLGRGLELNDNLQSLLAKHDAIASGSPLPAKVSESIPKHDATTSSSPPPVDVSESITSSRTPVVPQPAAISWYDDGEEDEDDDFAQLARRNSKIKSLGADNKSAATSGHLSLPNPSDTIPSTVASSSEPSSELTLPDPPTPVKTATKEQDIVDLLSITLSSNPSPPHTPLTPPVVPDQNGSPPVPSAGQGHPVNQADIPQNSYTAPWAQTQTHSPSPPRPQPQSEVFLNSSGYPPPPWATSDANANPFVPTTYQHPAPGTGGFAATYTSMQTSSPVQFYNSFGPRVNNVPATKTQTNTSLGHKTGKPTSPKPYVYANRLFDDLLDLRNPSTGPKASSPNSTFSGTSSQGMINGRK